MQALFTYGGNRKSAVTPRTLLFGALPHLDVFDDVGPYPVTPEQVASLSDVQSLNKVSDVESRILQINIALGLLNDYGAKADPYYRTRIDRTSGGKRDRLIGERAGILGLVHKDTVLLSAALSSARIRATALVTATQANYDPTSGMLQPSVPAQASGSSSASLLIPVGAALAALFFLKGH